MSLGAFSVLVALLWIVVGVHRRYNARPRRAPSNTPFASLSHRSSKYLGRWTVQHGLLRVQCHTSALNRAHDRLSEYFASRSRLRVILNAVYDAGCIFCAVGLATSLLLLAWTFFTLAKGVIGWYPDSSAVLQATVLPKRDAMPAELPGTSFNTNTQSILIQPLIPGVTVPLSHLLPLLFSLFLCQIIHEAGHAISAALGGVSLHSIGVSLSFVLPSAFVALDDVDLQSKSYRTRLRIVSAGAFHNITYFAFLLALGHVFPPLWPLLGYEDVSRYGRVVLGVDEDSVLKYHTPPGALITALDDVPLGSSAGSWDEDIWTSYLVNHRSPPGEVPLGWCTPVGWLSNQPTSCCNTLRKPVAPPEAQLSCFVTLEDASKSNIDVGHCLDPTKIMIPSSNPETDTPVIESRCSSASPCKEGRLCLRPSDAEQLIRLTIILPDWIQHFVAVNPDVSSTITRFNLPEHARHRSTVVLWDGPKEEIYEQVRVGKVRPRWSFLPLWLPGAYATLLEYLRTMTLSLYLFNLLPLPFLDGSQLLGLLLRLMLTTERRNQLLNEDEVIEMGVMESGTAIQRKSPRWLTSEAKVGSTQKMIERSTVVLISACIGLAIITWVSPSQ